MSYGVFCFLQVRYVPLTSIFCAYTFAYTGSRGKSMPRRVEPKSELVFRTAKARVRPYLLADGNGLALRVQPNGTKTWLLRYRRPGTGKENFLSLGPYPDVSLIDARKSASTARNLMREGTDPVEHRRAESAARKRVAEGAFHLVAERWLEFKRKEWADETYRKLSCTNTCYPRFATSRSRHSPRRRSSRYSRQSHHMHPTSRPRHGSM
jgi:hypothetical protein